jgi:serine/threonine protein kinase
LSLTKEERADFIMNANLKEIPFEIKISDFGFAKIIKPKQREHKQTICGTPAYMAPDVVISHN